MNLLTSQWIPVRDNGGAGRFRLLTYQELLCEPGNWQVSLPRDDLELACVQLLVCMTQVIFLPEDERIWRSRVKKPLSSDEFTAGIAPYQDWFDLNHLTQPFMQSRGVKATEETPIQKLMIGLPEGNNHAFFNEVGEVRRISGPIAAIALFHQASNCPSFGGGFKGGLRGGASITTLVSRENLRETIWYNVLIKSHIANRGIAIPNFGEDRPTWIEPIRKDSTIQWNQIGLMRGLFWQPARIELVRSPISEPCDLLGGEPVPVYTGFFKEKFNFKIEGVWPHPHGAITRDLKKDPPEKFVSFTTKAPAWTLLSDLVFRGKLASSKATEGSTVAGPITQFDELGEGRLNLMIGGYRTKQASVLERRHEMVSLAQGWRDHKERLVKLVQIGIEAKKYLRKSLFIAMKGNKDKGLKGIGGSCHEIAEKIFYTRTENSIYETFSNEPDGWDVARSQFTKEIAGCCESIFDELIEPYEANPTLIPIIAWTRRGLKYDLKKLTEES